jgi:ornithine carbamoyltransferase
MAKHLLQLSDFTRDELYAYIRRAKELKQETAEGIHHARLAGKTIAMIFEKASTRTRVSFEGASAARSFSCRPKRHSLPEVNR